MILVRNRVKNIFESHMMGFIRGRDASRMKIFFEIGNIFDSDTFTESDLMEPKTRKSIEPNKVNKLCTLSVCLSIMNLSSDEFLFSYLGNGGGYSINTSH